MSGSDLRKLAKSARLKPNEICAAADVSMPTLYKVYNDREDLDPESKDKVQAAITRLAGSARVVAV